VDNGFFYLVGASMYVAKEALTLRRPDIACLGSGRDRSRGKQLLPRLELT